MDICRLLNPNPSRGKPDHRVGRRRVEKACPVCAVKNHIRTTYCRGCNYKLRGPGRGGSARSGRLRAHDSASASLADAAASLALPPSGGRMKDRRRATQKLPPVPSLRHPFALFGRGREQEVYEVDQTPPEGRRPNPVAAYMGLAEFPVVIKDYERYLY